MNEHEAGLFSLRTKAVVLIAVVLMCLGLVTGYNTYRDGQVRGGILECLGRYNERLADALGVRSASTARRDEALTDQVNATNRVFQVFLNSFADPPPGRAKLNADFKRAVLDRADATKRVNASQKLVDETRAANPYPESPAKLCTE